MILLTGGTGFLGAHISAHLIGQGEEVCLLARSKQGLPATARVGRLLDWLDVPAGRRKDIRVLEGRIEEPGLGLEPDGSAALARRTREIVHCASNTSFAERKRAEVEAVNVNGLDHILDLAEHSGCRRLHLVSTAYVAGLTSGFCPEELVRPSAFTNVYEETKCRAEWLAVERCRKAGIPLTIYRPSIVYGHSETGRSLLFNALYYPVRTALFLKEFYERDIHERGGRKAADMGVRLDGDGWTFMPIRISVDEESGLNAIPVDFFVRAFGAIRENKQTDGIFHIVNSRLTKIEDIIGFAQKIFRIRGISACPAQEMEGKPRNALEAAFETYLEAYGPYMRDRRLFGSDRAGSILDKKGIRCPDLTYDVLKKCLDYGVQSGWGARLFES
ncbi:MAG: oxidoreductase, family [Candidatus Aminicenantes bacterium]|nr:oxidoreductase, family [Candidatus Aminicenantes bacterium]